MGMSLLFALGFVLFLLAMYIVLTWQVINGGYPVYQPVIFTAEFLPDDARHFKNPSLHIDFDNDAPRVPHVRSPRFDDAEHHERVESSRRGARSNGGNFSSRWAVADGHWACCFLLLRDQD